MVFSRDPTCRGRLPSPLLWGINSVSLLLTCTHTSHICSSITARCNMYHSLCADVQSQHHHFDGGQSHKLQTPAWRKLQQHGRRHQGKYCTVCHCTTTCNNAPCNVAASCTHRASETQGGPHREALMHSVLTGKPNAPEISSMLTAGKAGHVS